MTGPSRDEKALHQIRMAVTQASRKSAKALEAIFDSLSKLMSQVAAQNEKLKTAKKTNVTPERKTTPRPGK